MDHFSPLPVTPIMRKNTILSVLGSLLAAGTLTFAPLTGRAAPAPDAPATDLQLRVTIPSAWLPMLEENVTDVIYSRLTDVFERKGFTGRVTEVRSYQKASSEAPLLTINLVDWEMDSNGRIDVAFGARLATAEGSWDIGNFRTMGFAWAASTGRFGLSDAYGETMERALAQVYDRLAEMDKVPGLVPAGG